jgi:hypothetical protein
MKIYELPSFRKFIILFLLIILPSIGIGGKLLYKEIMLDKFGQVTNGKIVKIEHQKKRHFVHYKFENQNFSFQGAYTGTQDFLKNKKQGDNIKIIFNKQNPKNNRIYDIKLTNKFTAMIFILLGILFAITTIFRLKKEFILDIKENKKLKSNRIRASLKLFGYALLTLVIMQFLFG